MSSMTVIENASPLAPPPVPSAEPFPVSYTHLTLPTNREV